MANIYNANPYRKPPAHGPCKLCQYWVQCVGEDQGGCVKQGPSWLSNALGSQVFTKPWGGDGCDNYEESAP